MVHCKNFDVCGHRLSNARIKAGVKFCSTCRPNAVSQGRPKILRGAWVCKICGCQLSTARKELGVKTCATHGVKLSRGPVPEVSFARGTRAKSSLPKVSNLIEPCCS